MKKIGEKIRNWRRGRAARARLPGRIKTPTMIQMEAVECGAAALGIILGHFGSYIPLEELRVACGVSRDGSKAINIMKAARGYGLEVKGFRHEPAGLRLLSMPVILHWNFNHFVVLEGFHKDKVFLNDPAAGPRTVSGEELDEAFTGVVLTFAKGEGYQPQGKQPTLWQALLPRLKGSKLALLFVLLVSLALVIPGLLVPAFSRVFVDSFLIAGQRSWMAPLIAAMVATAGVTAALAWLQQRYLLRLETRLALSSASRLVWHVLRLPIEFFSQRGAGDISARVGQNDRIAQLLSGELATTLLNIILILFYAGLMVRYSIPLTLIGAGMAALSLLALHLVSRRRKDTNQRLSKEHGKLFSTTFAALQQIETLKSSGGEEEAFTRWAGYQAKVFNATQELGVLTQVVSVVPALLSQLTTIFILAAGGLLILDGQLTIGMLVAFQSLMFSFLNPVNQVVNLGGQLQEVDGIVTRLNDISNYKPDPQVQIVGPIEAEVGGVGEGEASERWKKLSGRIEIRHLTFGYSRLAPPLIEGFDLTVEPGSRVALVGGSGSGKSTIARLVTGLYTPWDGEVMLDGQPRQQIARVVLNSSLRMVDQEIFFFEGSIRDNLTMWDRQIPEADLIQAAKDAHIHDEISGRPGGYDFEVKEGGRNFSGGQRQRLEIARALVTNPSILILDEATSALDPVTEQIIDEHLRRRGCTCLIVAHRLSTIRDCDEIIVLKQGRVVERGTHDKLWRHGGEYTRLIKAETPESERLLDAILENLTV